MASKSSDKKFLHNWIERFSKTYPDQKFYFNVKTGEKSWEMPEGFEEKASLTKIKQPQCQPTGPTVVKSVAHSTNENVGETLAKRISSIGENESCNLLKRPSEDSPEAKKMKKERPSDVTDKPQSSTEAKNETLAQTLFKKVSKRRKQKKQNKLQLKINDNIVKKDSIEDTKKYDKSLGFIPFKLFKNSSLEKSSVAKEFKEDKKLKNEDGDKDKGLKENKTGFSQTIEQIRNSVTKSLGTIYRVNGEKKNGKLSWQNESDKLKKEEKNIQLLKFLDEKREENLRKKNEEKTRMHKFLHENEQESSPKIVVKIEKKKKSISKDIELGMPEKTNTIEIKPKLNEITYFFGTKPSEKEYSHDSEPNENKYFSKFKPRKKEFIYEITPNEKTCFHDTKPNQKDCSHETERIENKNFHDTKPNKKQSFYDTKPNEKEYFHETERNKKQSFYDTQPNEKEYFHETEQNKKQSFYDTKPNEKEYFHETEQNKKQSFYDNKPNEKEYFHETEPDILSVDYDMLDLSASSVFSTNEFSEKDDSLRQDLLYIAVDTCAWINHLDLVLSLKKRRHDNRSIVILIPFVVIKELDKLKMKPRTMLKSVECIKLINKHLEAKDEWVICQSYKHYQRATTLFEAKSCDEHILNCCYLFKQDGFHVKLFSSDINLRNLSIATDVDTLSFEAAKNLLASCETISVETNIKCINDSQLNSDIAQLTSYNKKENNSPKCMDSLNEKNKFELQKDIKLSKEYKLLLKLLGGILQEVMIEIYDELWQKIVLHRPPWSLIEVIECWNKHYRAIFYDKFNSSILHCLNNVKCIVKKSSFTSIDIENLQLIIQTLMEQFFKKHSYKKFLTDDSCDNNNLPSCLTKEINDNLPSCSTKNENSDFSLGLTKNVNDLASYSTKDNNKSLPSCSTQNNLTEMHEPSSAFLSHVPSTINIIEMLRKIGQFTNYIGKIILDVLGIPHSISIGVFDPLFVPQSLPSREEALKSMDSLQSTMIALGTTVLDCMTYANSKSVVNFGRALTDFWTKTHVTCPNLPFTEVDILSFVSSAEGIAFLKMYLKDVEAFINILIMTKNSTK